MQELMTFTPRLLTTDSSTVRLQISHTLVILKEHPSQCLQQDLQLLRLTVYLYSKSFTRVMAPVQITTPAAPLQPRPHTAHSIARQNIKDPDDANVQTVDALIRHRARINPHATIVSYPSSGVEFVDYSMQQLDVFAYRVARHYQVFIPTRSSSEIEPTTVALLGSSNFDYLVTMLALTKMGHTVLFLSTRISQLAIESLIKTTRASHLLTDKKQLRMAAEVQANLPFLHVRGIAGSGTFDFAIEVHADTRMDYQLDPAIEALNNIYIIHSSGMVPVPKTYTTR